MARGSAFFANRKLSKVPVGGGPVLQLADIGGNPRGAAWAPDGTIVVAPTQTSGLVRVPDGGGKPTPLTTLDKARGESSHRWPDVLPGGQWVLFTVGLEDASFDEARIDAVSLETGERRAGARGRGLRALPAGRPAAVRSWRPATCGRLRSRDVSRCAGRREVRARRRSLRLAQRRRSSRRVGRRECCSTDLVSRAPPSTTSRGSIETAGSHEPVDTPRPFRDLKASPDGRRIATVIGTSTESDLWLVDANGTLSRLSFELSPHRPTWTPHGSGITVGAAEGRHVAAAHDRRRWQAASPTVLFESPNRLYPNAWSPDGRYLIFQESRPDDRLGSAGARGRCVRTSGRRPASRLPTRRFTRRLPRSRATAAGWPYESDELDGVVQVYVRSFPDGAHKVRASSAGARWPAWDAHGNLHYWQTGDNTLRVVHTTEKGGQLSSARRSRCGGRRSTAAVLRRVVITVADARYDLEPGGTRFLVLEKGSRRGAGPPLSHPMVVLGVGDAAALMELTMRDGKQYVPRARAVCVRDHLGIVLGVDDALRPRSAPGNHRS